MKPSLEEYVTFLKSFLLSKGIMRQVKNNLANTTFSNDAIIQRNSLPIYTKALWLHNMAGEFFSFAFPWTKSKEKSNGLFYLEDKYQTISDNLINELDRLNTDEDTREFFGNDEINEMILLIKDNIHFLDYLLSKNQTSTIFVDYNVGMCRPTFINFKNRFFSKNQLISKLTDEMFKRDNYIGNRGTYALFCKMENPFYINCNGSSWESITLKPNNPHYKKMGESDRFTHLFKTSIGLVKPNREFVLCQKVA